MSHPSKPTGRDPSACRIERAHAREVFDSRGKPTVEVEVTCAGARPGRAIVPSGASTGKFEAVELRDGDVDTEHSAHRLDGTGVLRAVENVRGEIAEAVIGMDAADQQSVDRVLCELDGTENKSRLGANAILGVSLAAAHAAAEAKGVPLVEHLGEVWRGVGCGTGGTAWAGATAGEERDAAPSGESVPDTRSVRGTLGFTGLLGRGPLLPLPMVNMISGGAHAGGNLDFQDFLLIPLNADSFRQAMEWTVLVYRRLGSLLRDEGYAGTLVGDEGGYGPRLTDNSEAVELLVRAIEAAGLRPGEDAMIGLDVASTQFYADREYHLTKTNSGRFRGFRKIPGILERDWQKLSSDEMIDLLAGWVDRYPIISIEDGLAEEDWDGWQRLTARLGGRMQLIGDDLFVTNVQRLQRGIDAGIANSVLVKPNQIGTLWETLQTIRLAVDHGFSPVVSARSGETEDTTIADLAVATGAGQIKIGSVVRSERLAKYNQLLRLEERLAGAQFAGRHAFSPR